VSDAARHLRQMLLPEIGMAGQARLGAATARVGVSPSERGAAGLAHEIATRYALGAGFARVEPGRIDVASLAPRAIVEQEAAREVLAGARAALAAIRDALRQEVE